MEPSGADKGFFQTPPTLPNQVHDDDSYKRCFKPSQTQDEVAELGQDVLSDQVFTWVSDAYRNLPYLKGSGRSSFGHHTGELVTGEGWRELQSMGISKGYEAQHSTMARQRTANMSQHCRDGIRHAIWALLAAAPVSTPAYLAAVLCRCHLPVGHARRRGVPVAPPPNHARRVYEDAYRRLTSRDPSVAWTSGQWMTERIGGSDVSLTETVATRPANVEFGLASQQDEIPLGPWSLSGFKWFSSATDSKMTVLLARTSASGGLSAFIAPMRRHDPHATTMAGHPNPNGERLNGVRISRLKHKFGTQSLPTAELVLEGMRGWLIGDEGKGIHEISNVLTITRVYSAVSAVAYVGRALAIARAYARVREVGAGNRARMRLIHSRLHMRTLARMTGEYRGLMMLSLYSAYVLGVSEYPTHEYGDVTPALKALTPEAKLALPLIRVLSQITKAYVCKPSVALVFSCMEALGGVGYMDNEEQEYLNVSRIFRDVSVLPIWEGTTDVLSTDTIRALKHPKAGQECIAALDDVVGKAAAFSEVTLKGWDAVQEWKELRAKIVNTAQADLMGEARDLVWALGDILVSLLLMRLSLALTGAVDCTELCLAAAVTTRGASSKDLLATVDVANIEVDAAVVLEQIATGELPRVAARRAVEALKRVAWRGQDAGVVAAVVEHGIWGNAVPAVSKVGIVEEELVGAAILLDVPAAAGVLEVEAAKAALSGRDGGAEGGAEE
ncbi:acyl-CoA dehydrogenase [Cordyceps militaris CM01]|uniref:Acyl-CoA dehydrogenase n=1 Tax=Cordyceps militaris (strain CM01) TaxID=983644 RepID=G3JM26_CORMM|nr:acyl-CoA dehydrogenase [Cordyceps militaris CM01]EGX90750.1 acyl-CoA dehydrogenase [Cordyceps militaris CM01]